MSFWSWFSRPSRAPASPEIEPEPGPVTTKADRDFITTALDRFEVSGLAIKRELDRELIITRALVDSFRWKDDDTGAPSLQALFLAMAGETDSLIGEIGLLIEIYPPMAEMDDDAAERFLAEHSESIFVNAGSITLVSEADSLGYTINDLAGLGNIGIAQIELHRSRGGLLKATFVVEGLGPGAFEIEDRKRPEAAPLLAEMNRIAVATGRGRYLVVDEGSSDSDTFILADDASVPLLTALLDAQPAVKS
ncbi:hypothetical protein [Bradyrhizobium sp. HKCCYLS20291]|uniref:hypothetical protein n=1 Tax=Bradyrhizobium sp. HKCCYLS20291 TaxID=3420766 RepID=UPI003EB6A6F8